MTGAFASPSRTSWPPATAPRASSPTTRPVLRQQRDHAPRRLRNVGTPRAPSVPSPGWRVSRRQLKVGGDSHVTLPSASRQARRQVVDHNLGIGIDAPCRRRPQHLGVDRSLDTIVNARSTTARAAPPPATRSEGRARLEPALDPGRGDADPWSSVRSPHLWDYRLVANGFHEHPRVAMTNSVPNSGRDSTRPPGPATDRYRDLHT